MRALLLRSHFVLSIKIIGLASYVNRMQSILRRGGEIQINGKGGGGGAKIELKNAKLRVASKHYYLNSRITICSLLITGLRLHRVKKNSGQ